MQTKAFDYSVFNGGKKIFPFKIRAGLVIGKIHTLSGACLMNGAALAETFFGKEKTGTIFFGFKGVFSIKELPADLSVGKMEISGNPVDIFCCDIEG
jgi:hypothetical protein